MREEHTPRVAKSEVMIRKILRGKIQTGENRGNDPFILKSEIIKFGIKFRERTSSIFLIYYLRIKIKIICFEIF